MRNKAMSRSETLEIWPLTVWKASCWNLARAIWRRVFLRANLGVWPKMQMVWEVLSLAFLLTSDMDSDWLDLLKSRDTNGWMVLCEPWGRIDRLATIFCGSHHEPQKQSNDMFSPPVDGICLGRADAAGLSGERHDERDDERCWNGSW